MSGFGATLECAPGAGQVEVSDLTGELGFQRMKAMARQRSHSIEFKRQGAQELRRHLVCISPINLRRQSLEECPLPPHSCGI